MALVALDFKPVLEFLPNFGRGVLITLGFALFTIVVGTILGFLLFLLRNSRSKVLSAVAKGYIALIRGTPLLIQLYLFAYGLPRLIPGLNLGIYTSGLLALALNSSAYVAEIIRSGVQAVDEGQFEASRALGFSRSYTMWHIIFPQAIRNVIPSLGNEFVTIVKESSIVSILGIYDITRVSDLVKASTLKVFEALVVAALLYFVITSTLTYLIHKLEGRLTTYAKR
mgnify:CR=1 FL=1